MSLKATRDKWKYFDNLGRRITQKYFVDKRLDTELSRRIIGVEFLGVALCLYYKGKHQASIPDEYCDIYTVETFNYVQNVGIRKNDGYKSKNWIKEPNSKSHSNVKNALADFKQQCEPLIKKHGRFESRHVDRVVSHLCGDLFPLLNDEGVDMLVDPEPLDDIADYGEPIVSKDVPKSKRVFSGAW